MPEGKASRGRGLYLLRLVASVLLLGWQILCSSRALYSASRESFAHLEPSFLLFVAVDLSLGASTAAALS